MEIKDRDFERELQFQASRSGGAGGQNTNKVATKVELRFHVEERSQLQNKELCISRFCELLRQALTQQKKRKASKPTKASVRKRLEGKKKQADKKANRGYRADH